MHMLVKHLGLALGVATLVSLAGYAKEPATPYLTRHASLQDAFSAAARDGHLVALAALEDRGARLDGLDGRGRTALISAVDARELRAVQLLLRTGADPDAADADGRTPLMHAAAAGDRVLFDALQAAGADVHRQTPSTSENASNHRRIPTEHQPRNAAISESEMDAKPRPSCAADTRL